MIARENAQAPIPLRGPYFTLWPSLDETALRLRDETVTYGELLLIGAATGRLEEARIDTSRAARLLEGPSETFGEAELRREAEAFRRQRKLHSGDDLRSWLARRDLDEAQWAGHLRRSLALKSGLEGVDDSATDDEIEQALVVDLACAGWWGLVADEATRLWSAERAQTLRGEPPVNQKGANGESLESIAKHIAECLPILGILEVDWCLDRLRAFESRRQALVELAEACGEPGVIARRVKERAVDWSEFVYDDLRLPNRSVANEAAMCGRDDGMSPEEVAARSGRELEHRVMRRDQIPTGIAAMLTGAVPGDVLGPFDEDDGVHVVWLRERRAPSADDPKTREFAIGELLSERLDRAAAGKAVVVGPL